jgi:hypothetical protein
MFGRSLQLVVLLLLVIAAGAIEFFPAPGASDLRLRIQPAHGCVGVSSPGSQQRLQLPATAFPPSDFPALPLSRAARRAGGRQRPLAALLGPGTIISGLHAANKALICWCSDATLRDTVGKLLCSVLLSAAGVQELMCECAHTVLFLSNSQGGGRGFPRLARLGVAGFCFQAAQPTQLRAASHPAGDLLRA